jgi:hypothetical protein
MELTIMNRLTKAIFLLIMIILFSCEEKGVPVNCNDCTPDEPYFAVVKVEIDENHSQGVEIKIWEGRLEDNILLDSLITFSSSYERKVTINKAYTFTATYIINDKRYTAVDSATPRVRYTTDYCEEPCYYVYDLKYDLRLKYTK